MTDPRYDGHKSIHDDAMAESLGLRAGPIPRACCGCLSCIDGKDRTRLARIEMDPICDLLL
jgi:hypothetical protein